MFDLIHKLMLDKESNIGNFKGLMILFFFRITQFLSKRKILFILYIFFRLFYWIIQNLVFCFELSPDIILGKSFSFWHCHGTVVNKKVCFGDNCVLRHGTTIGNNGISDEVPIIGNNVNIGANTCIIGGIVIGNNVLIGAGAIVTKSIPSNCVVVGTNQIISTI